MSAASQWLYRAQAVNEFVPLLLPPDSPAISGTLWFHVLASGVYVADTPRPEAGDPGALAPHFLGMLGTVACWARGHGRGPGGQRRPRPLPGPAPPVGRAPRAAVEDRRAGGPDRGVGQDAPVLRPLRRGHRVGTGRAGHALPGLRPPRLPPPRPGRDRARHARRRGPARARPAVPAPDVLVPGRIRGARRDARGGRAPRGPRRGRHRAGQPPLRGQPAVALPALADDRVHGDVGRRRHRDRRGGDPGRRLVPPRRAADDPTADLDRPAAHRPLARRRWRQGSARASTSPTRRR